MLDLPELIVTDEVGLTECCDHLATVDTFGFDTEFVGEDTYHPQLCLVQVATAERRYLIDPLAIESLLPFWNHVIDPAKRVIVHAGREEIRLCHLGSGRVPGNLFDVQIAAGLLGLGYPLGHGALLQHLLHIQLAKGETLTDWRKRPLSKSQIRYAFDDVRYLLPLWQNIHTKLEARNRSSWAKEEFDVLLKRAVVENPAVEKWRKLRGIGVLDRRRLAIARALFIWRDETAGRHNRPARVILRDDLIVEIAKRNPKRDQDLHLLRGVPKNELDSILEVVEEAHRLPIEACPEPLERENDSPQVAMVVALLNAVLNDCCTRMELTPGMAATMSDLKSLVREKSQEGRLPTDSQLMRGWRREHILPELLSVLEGRKRIRIANLSSDSPLEYSDA